MFCLIYSHVFTIIMHYWFYGLMEQLSRPGQVLFWCLINLCPSKIVCSNITVRTFYSCIMVSSCLSHVIFIVLYGLMEQLSRPGQVLLWCLISLCISKIVCSNNTIGTFYSCRMVSSCYCHIYCILCIVNYILMFILLFFSMHDWLYGMEQNLARSSFGVLSVFSNNMIIGIEHFNLVEC